MNMIITYSVAHVLLVRTQQLSAMLPLQANVKMTGVGTHGLNANTIGLYVLLREMEN
jgi:Co/Zn/Cd efflux system component